MSGQLSLDCTWVSRIFRMRMGIKKMVLVFIGASVILMLSSIHWQTTGKPLGTEDSSLPHTKSLPEQRVLSETKQEQLEDMFTVVIPTFKREETLTKVIKSLDALQAVKTIIVVTPVNFSENFKMPYIRSASLKVEFVKDSLNSRFLPFDAIETEAVLHLDDDVLASHDVILQAFREWKSAKNSLVGISTRGHNWNNITKEWKYNFCRHSPCSMVMTHFFFLHKVYSTIYSNIMPEAIRRKVDELMNCEDIAMNFLVADILKEPPTRVSTGRIRFLRNNVSLHGLPDHKEERSICLNYFAQIYGHMPLRIIKSMDDA